MEEDSSPSSIAVFFQGKTKLGGKYEPSGVIAQMAARAYIIYKVVYIILTKRIGIFLLGTLYNYRYPSFQNITDLKGFYKHIITLKT